MEPKVVGHLISVNVGLPRDVAWRGTSVHTALWKSPVRGPRMVRRLNIDGDGQGDLAGHGGENRAVLAYQTESYEFWKNELNQPDLEYGQFGENLTVDGLPDAKVCIGDRYRIGGAVVEVTQPRVTCYRAGMRFNEPEMGALLVKHRRPGFYLRVIEEGEVETGDEIQQIAVGPERMSVAEVDALLYFHDHPPDQLVRALRIPALSTGWRRSFELLLEKERVVRVSSDIADRSGPPPAWSGFRRLQVTNIKKESEDVVSLSLQCPNKETLPTALPGQFVVLRFGPSSETTYVRSYSISGDARASTYRVSIKREKFGAASAFVHDQLKVGDTVDSSAPKGSFTLRNAHGPVVMLSAGIGVTPLLAMLHALAVERSKREIWWLHGARNGSEHPFASEVQDLLNVLARRHSFVCYSTPLSSDRLNIDFDAVGHLNSRSINMRDLPKAGDFYICGPSSFMSDMTDALTASDVARDQIHTEAFKPGLSFTPGIKPGPKTAPHQPVPSPASGATITFARSGLNVRWGSSFDNLLELAEACDVPVRWSCRTGVCQTCATGLIEGEVNYEPEPIDVPTDGNVLICCSRPRGDIVIDL